MTGLKECRMCGRLTDTVYCVKCDDENHGILMDRVRELAQETMDE